MIKAVASLITLLSVLMVLGYMAGEAQAQESPTHAVATSEASTDSVVTHTPKHRALRHRHRAVRASYRTSATPAKPSLGEQLGLHQGENPLALKSSVALVVDQTTGEPLLDKNSTAVLPIASITKLMTAMVVLEAHQPLDEIIDIDADDRDTMKGTRSRLKFGVRMSRADALHLALMASENRAAASLGRHYPGGIDAFVSAMNAKAAALGMSDTHYVDSSGLSPSNRSSARDLAKLVEAAYAQPLIREYTTSPNHAVLVGRREVEFRNTNRLVRNPDWSIGLQKTGYISEAGQCLVMQAEIAGHQLVMVLLDAQGRLSRIADAVRIRHWIERAGIAPAAPAVAPAAAHPIEASSVPTSPAATPAVLPAALPVSVATQPPT